MLCCTFMTSTVLVGSLYMLLRAQDKHRASPFVETQEGYIPNMNIEYVDHERDDSNIRTLPMTETSWTTLPTSKQLATR